MLSNEQIEIQRKRFEKANPPHECLTYYAKINSYIEIGSVPFTTFSNNYDCKWKGWLSRVESNELHITEFQDATFKNPVS